VRQLVVGVLVLCAALVTSCGGRRGTLSVQIQVPVGADPFERATQAVISVGEPPIMQRIVPVTGGHFDANIQFEVKANAPVTGPIVVEARDSNRILGYGRTPVLAIVPVDEVVTVWVGRPGYAGRSPSDLTRGRVNIAAGPIPRLGVLLTGGTVNGVATGDAEVYHQYTHEVLKAEAVPTPRSGAVVIGFDRLGSTTGASLLVSGATTTTLSDELIAFDPVAAGTSAGKWTALSANDNSLRRVSPALARIPGGTWLLCGGLDALGGTPLQTATQLSVGSALLINETQPMAVPRAGGKAVGGQFANQDGALIIGGNQAGTATIERFIAADRTFRAVPLSDQLAPRTGHSVAQLANGMVVVTGGHESSGPLALASGWIINPITLEIIERDILSTPRSGHVTFVAGNELIACGGINDQGEVLGNCEALDGTTLAPLGPQRTSTTVRRTDLIAVQLETGEILLAGGIDTNGNPVTALELYTPIR
jgi:hypothetical protein